MDCIFCKIVKNEMPSVKIYEDDTHIAFLDLFPASMGHTLLVPKKHYVNIFDAEAETETNVYSTLHKLAKAIQEATGCIGMNILQNNGAEAGQMVFHSHVHLVPRYNNDGVHIKADKKEKAEDTVLAEVAANIKKYL